jgi:hypothetical protein
MPDADLDTTLTELRQEFTDTLFVIGIILELRRAAQPLREPLAEELHTIRTMIDQLSPLS